MDRLISDHFGADDDNNQTLSRKHLRKCRPRAIRDNRTDAGSGRADFPLRRAENSKSQSSRQ